MRLRGLGVSLFHSLLGFERPNKSNRNYKRILILRVSALGDSILSFRAIHALKQSRPTSSLYLCLTASATVSISRKVAAYSGEKQANPIQEIIPDSLLSGVITIGNILEKESIARFKSELSSIQPDAVLVLPQQGGGNIRFWANRLIFLHRSGFRGPVFGWRTRKSIEEATHSLKPGTAIHASEFPNYAVCDLLNKDYSLVCNDLFNVTKTAHAPRAPDFSKSIQAKIEQWLRAKHRIAISIGAMQEHKQWPIEQFNALIGRLLKHYDVAVILLGTKEYTQPGDDIVGCYPNNVLNLCGCTNVGQLAYVLKSAQICIANDGGTTHLASALGTPTVALIPGIEPPGSVDPYGWDKFSVRHEIACAPCYSFLNCPKGHRQCMLAIPVDHVVQKIVSIFNEYIHFEV